MHTVSACYSHDVPMSQFWVLQWSDGDRGLFEYKHGREYMHNWGRHAGYCQFCGHLPPRID